MHKYLDRYPPAPMARVEDARRRFPYRRMSAAEYAAREGVGWDCFSFGEYVYPDPALNDWIHSLDDILFTPGGLAEARRKHLSESEIAERAD